MAALQRRLGVAALVVSSLVALWSGWRYRNLDHRAKVAQHALLRRIAVPPESRGDPSIHVSRAVEASEGSFDELVLLRTARRIALIVCLSSAAAAIVAGLVVHGLRSSDSQ
jgi:hypothetical protein